MSAVVPRLELRQGQSLVMTQQLQQSIKLLQLSSQELVEYIEQEVEKNPLLSLEEESGESEPAQPDGQGDGDAQSETTDVQDAVTDVVEASGAEVIPQGNDDEDYGGGAEMRYETRGHSRINDEYEDSGDSLAVSEVTLRDHLMNQFAVAVTDPAMRIVGQHLIDLVDESGYIKEDLSGLAELLGCDQQLIEDTFGLLHTFDPAGVCARTLKECLAIQLKDNDRLDPAMQVMLDHLDLMASGNIGQLSKICGVDAEDIRDMCAEIRALNPRPGLRFQHEDVQAVIPDVLLRPLRGERWHVELNSAALPKVLVNRQYYVQLTTRTLDKAEKKYVSDQLAVANWLVKALDQRANTILKVSSEIVVQQDAFFRYGIKHLRPLTLKEVAAATDLHESTISRVTSSKFISTPRGTFELKYFFNASVGGASGGEAFSNKTVQYIIKEMIDAEPASSPLSDDTLAENLKSRGIDIARRTVAKYREIMNIPSSSQRRRLKKL